MKEHTVKWRLEQTEGQLPHLACRLRQFTAEDVGRCVGRRRWRGSGTTHIAYVGDSRIRQHVEVLIDLLRDLQPRITTYKGVVLTPEQFLGAEGMMHWKKYKHDFRVECVRAPGLMVDFHWAALIDKGGAPRGKEGETRVGALHLIRRWLRAPKGRLPDVVILNTGAWQLMDVKQTIMDQIDDAAVTVMKKMRPMLKRLATRTTLVWALPDPFKEYISHIFGHTGHYTQQSNEVLEWLLNAQISLQPPGIIIWDSFLPIAFVARSDCMHFYAANISENLLGKFSNFLSFITWQCFERMHVGLEALSVAVQMVLNHVCNPYMVGMYCCSMPTQSPNIPLSPSP